MENPKTVKRKCFDDIVHVSLRKEKKAWKVIVDYYVPNPEFEHVAEIQYFTRTYNTETEALRVYESLSSYTLAMAWAEAAISKGNNDKHTSKVQ